MLGFPPRVDSSLEARGLRHRSSTVGRDGNTFNHTYIATLEVRGGKLFPQGPDLLKLFLILGNHTIFDEFTSAFDEVEEAIQI